MEFFLAVMNHETENKREQIFSMMIASMLNHRQLADKFSAALLGFRCNIENLPQRFGNLFYRGE